MTFLAAVQPGESGLLPHLLRDLERRRLSLAAGAKRRLRTAGTRGRGREDRPQSLGEPLPAFFGRTVGPHGAWSV
jgi:hypothetical protein